MIADGIIKEAEKFNCVDIMKRELIEYIVGQSVTCAYPVLGIYSNQRKVMQGGFISAAFDNTFGAMIYYTTNRLDMATLDINVNYHRPIVENDKLIVTVHLKSLGRTIIRLTGEAFNKDKKLIATATANFMWLK
jgi:uncharacterized protein (TIGR00369 family)